MLSRKVLCLLVIALFYLYGYASIVIVPGSGASIPASQEREVHVRYHGDQDDYHIYGSTQWAVRFDFQDFYPSVPDCRFITSKARIFFPNAASSATVSLFADADSLPTGNALRQVNAPITNQVMDFTFPDTLSASVIWMVVDYTPNGITSFVSASAGGGSHSYYLNTTATVPFLQSMNAAGYHAELRFGLLGSFALDSPDLELVSFSLDGNLLPRALVRPVFTIYNHSDIPISDASIVVEFTSPADEFTLSDTIAITESIAAHDSLIVSAPGYGNYSYELPTSPMQIRVKGTLSSGFTEPNNLLHNNIITSYHGIYANPYPFYLAENFLRTNMVNTILPLQDDVLTSRFRTLNYFPSLSDSLGNLASLNRFDWYGLNTYPTLAINGMQRIYGFPSGYESRLQNLHDSTLSLNTFISSDTVVVNDIPNSDNIQLNFVLTNGETLLYDSATLNPALQSRFFAGLFKRINLADSTRYVLQRWIAFADTINNPLPIRSSLTKTYTFNHPNISAAELIQDYCIFFWMQTRDGGTIHYADSLAFISQHFTAVEDDLLPVPKPFLYPNPLHSGSELKIAQVDIGSGLKLYNLRGQLIWSSTATKSNMAIPHKVFPTSGIYFIKIESIHSGKHTTTMKISYIK